MGKIQRRSVSLNASVRHSPMNEVKDMADSELNATPLADEFCDHLSELKAEILSKLLHIKPTERECGAYLFANIVESNKKYFNGKLQTGADGFKTNLHEMVRTLAPMLIDESEIVRKAATHSICQLALLSGDVCNLLVDADVLTPIRGAFEKYYGDETWMLSKSKQLKPIFCSLCDLLAAICSDSSKALKVFNTSDIPRILIKTLTSYEMSVETAIASAECLNVVTEENITPDLISSEFMGQLKQFMTMSATPSNQRIYFATLCASILWSLNNYSEINCISFKEICSLIELTLSLQCDSHLMSVCEIVKKMTDLEDENSNDSSSVPCIEELKHILSAKITALELMTNICSENDENEMEVEEACDANENEDDIDETEGMANEFSLSPEDELIITEKEIFAKVMRNVFLLTDECRQTLINKSLGRKIISYAIEVQRRGLMCINNLVMCLPGDQITLNDENISNIVSLLNNNTVDEATTALRAIAERKCDLLLSRENLNLLAELYSKPNIGNGVKLNLIKIYGQLGSRFTKLEDIEIIVTFLLEQMTDQCDIALYAELVDALIDVFSEDGKTDILAKKVNLMQAMTDALKRLKKDTSKGRKKMADIDPVLDTVKFNLNRFIKYKKNILK